MAVHKMRRLALTPHLFLYFYQCGVCTMDYELSTSIVAVKSGRSQQFDSEEELQRQNTPYQFI